jgi:hypothetical protein
MQRRLATPVAAQNPLAITPARMNKPRDKTVAHVSAQLPRALLLEPLTRVVNLAAVALGILCSKRLPRGQSVTAPP